MAKKNTLAIFPLLTTVLFFLHCIFVIGQTETHIRKKKEIKGGIAPKSVVASGHGLFSAQNMMYRHTVTIYNSDGVQLAKINDAVNLNSHGFKEYHSEKYKGAPVEGVFTEDGKFLWVSNYNMSGSGFENHGCDNCRGENYDPSFLYKINTVDFKIESIVKVGSVPKFLAISPSQKILLVSNWVSSDISIIDLEKEIEVKRISVGAHPRGITITQNSKTAFVTIMGSTKIAEIDLESYAVSYITKIGRSPRSIVLADNDSTLYISLNSSNEVLKYNRFTNEKKYCKTLGGPRSMIISPNEDFLYVVNYFDDSFTKINTDSMKIEAVISTGSKPIGICGNWPDSEIWVACYSGKIEIFKDFQLENSMNELSFLGIFSFPFDTDLFTENDSDKKPLSEITINETDTFIVDIFPKEKTITTTTRKVNINNVPDTNTICNYHIIIGAFSVKENAQKKTAELIAKGYPAIMLFRNNLNYVSANCFQLEKEAEIAKVDIAIQVNKSAWILNTK